MNPKTWTKDSRKVVWTVSVNNDTLYCLYVHGVLTHEDLPFKAFYPLLKRTVESV